ncbi:NAD(+) diphosphatase [Sansalvadorimonas sp. 2012CJ34-2]|uniref:NAD(+) diphosphatase n=1 Tax=Parendozoicomonas callyspongiae TaxID=2942213 RepID=A0ABT0PGE9_9GAMM|nr:NAD(+) diphosphatase [Sansalvadorimonas sp. 2012CJ34-2]MCL6269842.1 NAD(+) diphosphatase [Sansalvadorimonas sp. 2012CJ34-2]
MILHHQDLDHFQIEAPTEGSSHQWLYLVFVKGQIVPAPDQGYCWTALPVQEEHILQRHTLGSSDTCAFVAVEVAPNRILIEPEPLRSAIISDKLPGQILLQAGALINWGRNFRFCPRCKTRLEPVEKGADRSRTCSQCSFRAYPVLSPCIIVLITRGDSILLARSHRHPPGFRSLVAGFVEPGEDLEQAVAREVMEETGIKVTDIQYSSSQPWPFPHNLMVGFTARYESGELTIDPEELAAADWYPVDKLPKLPPKQTIARSLIDRWVERCM